MVRRGFVERRLQVVAQGCSESRFVARLDLYCVDQGRPEARAIGMQPIAECLRLGGEPLYLDLCLLQGIPRLVFLSFSGRESISSLGKSVACATRKTARTFRLLLGGPDVGC